MFDMGIKGTKWTIFNVSIDLFASKGYSNVSVRDIASAVGIKAASLYNHFKSKEEILLTIYEFYDYYYGYFMPSLDSIMEFIGKEPPKQTLKRALFRFDPSIQDIMDKTFLIASVQLYDDLRAQKLIFKNIFELSDMYNSAILNSMIDKRIIKPLDVKAFSLTLTSLCHSAALRMRTTFPIEWDVWLKSVELLYDQIIEI